MDTPEHYIEGSSPEVVAYCLEHAKSSPSSSGSNYSTTNVLTEYSSTVRKGIYAILQSGYPYYKPSNLSAKEARYATANALRFWMSEKNQPNTYNFMDLSDYSDSQLRSYASSGTIPNHVRAKSNTASNREVLSFAVELLIIARNQATISSSITFSPSSLSFTESSDGNWFYASTQVTLTNCNTGYTLNSSGLPGGSVINGYTGNNGDSLTIYIPANFANASKAFSLTANGTDTRSTGNIVAYKATDTDIQTVVNAYLDSDSQVTSKDLSLNTPTYIQPLPDLVVTSLTTDKASYNSGETATVNAAVYNNSNRSCDASYWVRTRSNELGEMNWQRWGSLGPYATGYYSYSFTVPSSTSAITLDFYADAGFEVAELNEGNNEAVKTINITRLPDLAVASFTTDKNSYIAGETVKVNATVVNNSDAACGAFWYHTASDKIGDLNWQRCSGLGARATGIYSFSFIAPSTTASVNLTFYADANNEIQEIYENNNTASKTIAITALPDLTVASLTTDKPSYFPGDTVTVSATVKNIGSSTSPSSSIRLTPGAFPVQDKSVVSLAVGATTHVTWNFVLPNDDSDVQKTMTLNAFVDPNNTIQELSETNNSASSNLIIAPTPKPDLQIIGANTVDWYGGKDVIVSAKVRNNNAVAVPSVTVRIKAGTVQKDEVICVPGSAENLAVFRFTVPLPSGQSQQLNIVLTVDPENMLKESNESNNTYSKTQTIYTIPPSYVADPDEKDIEDAHKERHKAVPVLSNIPSSSIYHTWQEYRFEGNNYVLKNFWARLITSLEILPDSRITYADKPKTMESGFGVQASCRTVVSTNYDNPDKLVGSQLVWLYTPETLYGTVPFENYRDNLINKTGHTGDMDINWQLDVNPYSVTNARLHYTPIWFPNASYTIWAQAFYAWSPVGQLYENITDSVTIKGDMYDRITTIRR